MSAISTRACFESCTQRFIGPPCIAAVSIKYAARNYLVTGTSEHLTKAIDHFVH